ncbi:MAG: hypothetical protein EBR09_16430 [Proteobacteria bacterium]|nr:hypothetical protein [Pseudomonadota bacterium]
MPCAAGTFSAAVGAASRSTCVACAAGTFSAAVGANTSGTCVACATGTFSETPGANASGTCVACAAGTFSAAAGANTSSACRACAAGTYSALAGSTACLGCPAYASSPPKSASARSCVCSPGLELQPTLAARFVQVSDAALEQGAELVLSRGVNVSVRWESLQLQIRDARGAVVGAADGFESSTQVFVAEDAPGELYYEAASASAATTHGRVVLLPAQLECVQVATQMQDAFFRVFVSPGRLDDRHSCRVRCAPGFFRTHNLPGARCQPHWRPVCGAGEFLVAGTPESNAYCRTCSGCAGQRLVRACQADADDECAPCGEPRAADEPSPAAPPAGARVWVNAHGEPCREGCAFGLVLDQRTRACEPCTHRCPPGARFPPPAARANCTHCVACESFGARLPLHGVWDAAEDREDCVAACAVGFRLRGGGAADSAAAFECVEVPPVDRRVVATPPPVPARCAEGVDAGAACALPGCRLHRGVCTPCVDIPEARPALPPPVQELLPRTGIMSADDKMRLRWQFTSACEWACLSPWVPVQSADRMYWKCETREVVDAILALNSWSVEPSEGHVEWVKTQTVPEPEAALQTERMLRLVVVLACVGAPVAMLLCVLCMNITRACLAVGDHAKLV